MPWQVAELRLTVQEKEKELELACTDMGGFPPPAILWFRDHTPLG